MPTAWGRPVWIQLAYFYNTLKVTFWINSVNLAQPIKLFYKTKGISRDIFLKSIKKI